MEAFQQFQLPSVQSSGLVFIQETGEADGFVAMELCRLPDVVLVQNMQLWKAKGLTCFTNPSIDFFVQEAVLHCLHLSSFDGC